MSGGNGGGGAGKHPCPQCGKPASGNFCQNCGAALGARFCNQCGAKLSGTARFCNQCGAKAPGAAGGPASRPAGAAGGGAHRAAAAATVGGGNAPWWIAGVALFGLIVVVGWNMVRPGERQPPSTAAPQGMPAGGGALGPATTDISNMSPREAADRLYDHVMRSLSAGDTATALQFQPMAVQAYERAEPLDLDGMFHEALLELMADPASAEATAQRILEAEPDHILGLGVAAQAALAMGDSAKAKDYYQHLLRVYDAQSGRNLVEYDGHKQLMTEYRALAQQYIANN